MIERAYVDGPETRPWELLKDMDRAEALRLYPDFDVAYLRAAYVTPSIDDHHMAEIDILKDGLEASIRKSEILARLSCWHMWNATANEFAFGSASAAVKMGINALLAGGLPPGPGSRLQAFQLAVEVSRYVDRKLSDDLYWKGPRGKPGPKQQREIRVTAELCTRSFPRVIEWARDALVEHFVPLLP